MYSKADGHSICLFYFILAWKYKQVMKKICSAFVLLLLSSVTIAQKALKVISIKETERIERILSADDMQGRRTFTPGIEKAANFIASEFEKTGLQKWNNGNSYLQSFSMVRTKTISQKILVNGLELDAKKAIVVSPSKSLVADSMFVRFAQMRSQLYSGQPNVIMLLVDKAPSSFRVELSQELTEMPLSNVVGVIPGKSKANEYVIFSGHYDHLGINSKKMENNDSIYNGANDDAAGTTAMIMLAKYFKKLNNNERTLVFAAFTAEEIGGFGATYFSKQFDPAQVMAMFNIEMIGTESKWGKNSAYITGFEKTNMGEILQNNLKGTDFTFHPDPYPTQQLFYRSDNATLARLGVPAHTISTSKMDSEPNYHKASDEIGTLDMQNMAAIIRAIALSSKGIVSGKETPSRVDVSALR